MHKSLNIYGLLVIAAVIAAGMAACKNEGPDNRPDDPLKVSRKSILVGGDAEKVTVGINARTGWTIDGYENWCSVSENSGEKGLWQVIVDFSENEEDTSRETVLVVTSGGIEREISVKQLAAGMKVRPPNQNAEYDINEQIYEEVLKPWYLWNAEVGTTVADYNQDYDRFFFNYLTNLKKNTADGWTWAQKNERYLYSYVERRAKGTPIGEPTLNFGMEFDMVEMYGDYVGRILYVQKDSPAASAGLKRGDWFRRINNRQMGDWNYKRLADSLARPVHGESMTLRMVDLSYQRRFDDYNPAKYVTLTPAKYEGSPILYSQVIDHTNREGQPIKTAYLAYTNFDPKYDADLITAFSGFKTAGVNSLVLDLRYSKNGSVRTAELMANLIAPEAISGKTFVKYQFNEQTGREIEEVKFAPHAQSIGVPMLIVLTTTHTAGPAELVINGFNAMGDDVKLIVVGEVTEGMNAGMVPFRDAVSSEEYEYDAYPVAFECFNANGEGKYSNGISPNGHTVSEWEETNLTWVDWEWKAGAKHKDALLVTALQYAEGNIQPPTLPAIFPQSGSKQGLPRNFSVRPAMIMEIE